MFLSKLDVLSYKETINLQLICTIHDDYDIFNSTQSFNFHFIEMLTLSSTLVNKIGQNLLHT